MSFNILENLSSVSSYLIPFLFVLTIVVFFHELGHFLVARMCGVRILVFSVGFGPELFGFNDRYGTRWKFAAIPLGGYVKFFGRRKRRQRAGPSGGGSDEPGRARAELRSSAVA